MRHPRLSAESLLDSQATWTTVEFVHVPLWLDWWVQVCDGHSQVPSQVQEGREAIERVPVRRAGPVLLSAGAGALGRPIQVAEAHHRLLPLARSTGRRIDRTNTYDHSWHSGSFP
jgi:hypothetical protein